MWYQTLKPKLYKAWKLIWKRVIDTRTYQYKWRQEDGANQYKTTGRLPDTLPKTQRLNPNPKSQPFILNCKLQPTIHKTKTEL